MKEIDWSKAPEGAEYWCELQWFKTLDGEWRVWCPGVNSWVKPAYAAPDNFSWWGNAIKRPAVWSGEGLPPVGTVCEVRNNVTGGWDAVDEVLAHTEIQGTAVAVFKRADRVFYSRAMDFRPLPTPEQIAAEEREKACEEMLEIVKSRRPDPDIYDAIGALYDAGYRRQEPKE